MLTVEREICRWLEVGEEVQEAAKAGLPGLSEEEVQAQLCFALLRSARFNLAKTYLTGTLCDLHEGPVSTTSQIRLLNSIL